VTRNKLPELPVVTGATLRPKTIGPLRFYPVLFTMLRNLKDIKAARERRTKRGPVPVPFLIRKDK